MSKISKKIIEITFGQESQLKCFNYILSINFFIKFYGLKNFGNLFSIFWEVFLMKKIPPKVF